MNIKIKSLTIKKCFVLLLLILSSNISVAQDCLDSESYYQYINLKSATPFPKCYLHKEEWTFDS